MVELVVVGYQRVYRVLLYVNLVRVAATAITILSSALR